MKDFDRNYGLPQGEPLGVPVAKQLKGKMAGAPCPNCGCNELMEITVEMKQSLLKGGKGKGTYLGCPACPYASPCMVVAGG